MKIKKSDYVTNILVNCSVLGDIHSLTSFSFIFMCDNNQEKSSTCWLDLNLRVCEALFFEQGLFESGCIWSAETGWSVLSPGAAPPVSISALDLIGPRSRIT